MSGDLMPDELPESVSYPEALRRMAAVAREDGESTGDADDVEFGAKVAGMLEVAAERWGDRRYRGDRLLQTVADFGRYGAETVLGLKVEEEPRP